MTQTSTKLDQSETLNDLSYWAQEFGRLCGIVAYTIGDSNRPLAVQEVDAAILDATIDAWNVLINRAPKVLKRLRLDYLG